MENKTALEILISKFDQLTKAELWREGLVEFDNYIHENRWELIQKDKEQRKALVIDNIAEFILHRVKQQFGKTDNTDAIIAYNEAEQYYKQKHVSNE